ncbi:methionine ABC transporter permease [Bartonella schoenbuchensis]|uniref:D-methionine transport system permease protein n=1 Tax=Bartonella schoenbuchensis (strain DSM 13525 / NCTC 13165 / R1) TaxID=687861 RepID=E6Z0K8_BARSR|nr:methionine ABC transporter permease [Bartonella schoenbuchensis]AQX31116.1 D-methionine transport system permease protein [Bartonella schoenbuchensis R1]CBI82646.1 permease protein of ABC transporter [Bartonella schoenbuchensis R1]
MFNVLFHELPGAVFDTLFMTITASFMALIVGLPLGLLLYTTAYGSLFSSRLINRPLSIIIDSVRAIPFIILAFYLLPVTRIVVGSGVGIFSVIFVLTISAIPFYARIAELSFKTVEYSLVEAVRSMGASRFQIVRYVLIPEALPSLITGFTVMVISLISATSLAGYLGGGGLGDMAIRYGYQRYNTSIMTIVIIFLIILNIFVQWFGNRVAQKFDRTKH